MSDEMPTREQFEKTAEGFEADYCVALEEFFVSGAEFLDGCVARGELDQPTVDKVKSVLSRHLNSGKQEIRDRIEQAKATLFLHGDEPCGEQ